MRHKRETEQDEMRPEYDFDYTKAVRGKHYRRLLMEGANVVVLEPETRKSFAIPRPLTMRYVLCYKCRSRLGAPLRAQARRRASTPPVSVVS